jgi:hypothetical protein
MIAVAHLAAFVIAASSGAPCHVDVAPGDGLPEADRIRGCTPGRYVALSRAEACASKDRPSTPAAVRREVLRRYGLATWSGKNGEIDHMQPFWLGGRTTAGNLWPEPGKATNNEKDALENLARRRVCVIRTMRLRTARRIFAADWRVYYRRYRRRGLL